MTTTRRWTVLAVLVPLTLAAGYCGEDTDPSTVPAEDLPPEEGEEGQ